MRGLAITLLIGSLLLRAVLALAQICPPLEPGYVRQPRPHGVTPNYPPPGEPFCRGTNEAASHVSCILCHDYLRRNAA